MEWRKERTRAPEKDLFEINGDPFVVRNVSTNALTKKACESSGLESVDLYTIETDFDIERVPWLKPETVALTFFSPSTVDISYPLRFDVCTMLSEVEGNKSLMEIYTYENEEYTKQEDQFLLSGELRCRSMINLGFYLLRQFTDTETRTISTVTLVDAQYLRKKRSRGNRFIDDTPIAEFNKARGVQVIRIEDGQRECDAWVECERQKGEECIFHEGLCI